MFSVPGIIYLITTYSGIFQVFLRGAAEVIRVMISGVI